MAKVLNFYHIGMVIPPGAEYMGRAMKKFGLAGSKFANPFPLEKGGGNRDEVIEKYRVWLWEKIRKGEITLQDLLDLDGKDLVCFCSPKRCHCDVIIAAIEWAKQRSQND
ncbi:putative ribonucleoside-diphosphate reductase 1 alpha subunit [Salmonella phage GEC_vB_MG]|nr:putative ribonucleoside-diphosphate reductase 1 alpha subunit [Salmonella phage GEC_vB_MG]WAK43519.1 NrdA.1-like protein [Cronobacter phage EspYZU15]